MAFFSEFPHTRTYDSDLGWIIARMKQLINDIDTFTSFNTIKFADNPIWNIENAYEANTLVLDRFTEDGVTNEITYVSKKAVPRGVDISNTEYWMKISDYNAGLDEIRRMIAENYTELSGDIATAQSTADAGVAAAQSAQSDADALEKIAVAGSWNSADVVLIGDSYSAGTGSNDGNGWPYYFKNLTGCNEVGHAYQNGGGFAAVGNENATYPGLKFHECITEIANDMSAAARDSVKLVIMQSGWNDASTNRNPDGSAAVVTGLEQALSKCASLFKNALAVIIPTWSTGKLNSGTASAAVVWNIIVNNLGGASYYGRCISCVETTSWFYGDANSFDAGDGIHYNAAGYRRMANYIFAVTKGWSGRKVISSRSVTNVSGVTGTLYVTAIANEINIHGSVTVASLPTNTWTELGTLPAAAIPTATKYMMGVIAYGGSGSRAPLELRLAADGGIGVHDLGALGSTKTNIPVYVDVTYKVQTP